MFDFFNKKPQNNQLLTERETLNFRDKLILIKQAIKEENGLSSNESINIQVSIHIDGDKQKAQEIMKSFGILDTEIHTGSFGVRCLSEEKSDSLNYSYAKEPEITVFYGRRYW